MSVSGLQDRAWAAGRGACRCRSHLSFSVDHDLAACRGLLERNIFILSGVSPWTERATVNCKSPGLRTSYAFTALRPRMISVAFGGDPCLYLERSPDRVVPPALDDRYENVMNCPVDCTDPDVSPNLDVYGEVREQAAGESVRD